MTTLMSEAHAATLRGLADGRLSRSDRQELEERLRWLHAAGEQTDGEGSYVETLSHLQAMTGDVDWPTLARVHLPQRSALEVRRVPLEPPSATLSHPPPP